MNPALAACWGAAFAALAGSALAEGTWGLSQEAAPTSKPWDKPATILWTSEDGTKSASIDAALSYKWDELGNVLPFSALKSSVTAGLYAHRNTAKAKETNDRGGKLTYTAPFAGGSGEPSGHEVSASLKVGRRLIIKRDDAGAELSRGDQRTDSEMLFFTGFRQWAIKSVKGPNTDPTKPSRDQTFFVDYKAGLYSDRGYGPKTDDGRLTGAQVGLTFHWFPVGVDAPSNKIGQVGYVPQLYVGAQVQHDLADSGQRVKDSYKLYTVGINVDFGKLSKSYGELVPSLSLERSVGADLIEGRSNSGLTQLTFGLTF